MGHSKIEEWRETILQKKSEIHYELIPVLKPTSVPVTTASVPGGILIVL